MFVMPPPCCRHRNRTLSAEIQAFFFRSLLMWPMFVKGLLPWFHMALCVIVVEVVACLRFIFHIRRPLTLSLPSAGCKGWMTLERTYCLLCTRRGRSESGTPRSHTFLVRIWSWFLEQMTTDVVACMKRVSTIRLTWRDMSKKCTNKKTTQTKTHWHKGTIREEWRRLMTGYLTWNITVPIVAALVDDY